MKANISIHPYRDVGWKGWVVAVEDPVTKELWQRPFYYKKDAERLKEDIEEQSLESILGIYGTHYFVQVR